MRPLTAAIAVIAFLAATAVVLAAIPKDPGDFARWTIIEPGARNDLGGRP